jgi:hypothetical protein
MSTAKSSKPRSTTQQCYQKELHYSQRCHMVVVGEIPDARCGVSTRLACRSRSCLIRTHSLLKTRLSAFARGIRKQFVTTGRRKHRPYPCPSFFETGRSTLLTESSGRGKKRKIINDAQAHEKSTCHIPKDITPLPISFSRPCIALIVFSVCPYSPMSTKTYTENPDERAL